MADRSVIDHAVRDRLYREHTQRFGPRRMAAQRVLDDTCVTAIRRPPSFKAMASSPQSDMASEIVRLRTGSDRNRRCSGWRG